MFDFFPDQPAFQYPDMVNIAYSLAWSFILAALIAITHKLTFHGESYPKHLFQALVLGSIVTAMVMMAIGDSLARGLGVFGAMAIIRFSTRIEDPRNVIFLLAAMCSGLAVGVFGFAISFAGTIVFCSAAFVMHFSPFKMYAHDNKLEITIAGDELRNTIEEVLQKHCGEIRQTGIAFTKEELLKLDYSLSVKSGIEKNIMIQELKRIEGVKRVSIITTEFNNNRI
jgi:hypothetical protein